MRVSFAILVAVVAVFTSSGLASVSNPAQMQQLAPASTENVEKVDGGARFLRKSPEDESDDLTNEERLGLGNTGTKIKQFLKGETRLAKLFEKSDEKLFKKDLGPNFLIDAAKRLEKNKWPAEQVKQFKAKGEQYSTYWYANFKEVVGP